MMHLYRHVPSSRLSETLLYRGDQTHVDQFDIGLTDPGALFGAGIYLTTDPAVAHDYTVARGEHVVYQGSRDEMPRTTKDLIRGYVTKLASEFDQSGFRDAWVRKHGYGARYNGLPSSAHRDMEADEDIARREQMRSGWHAAYERVKAELPSLRVTKLTTGELRLVKVDRPAVVSAFDIPEDYLARTLHGDRPLSDRDIQIIRKLWIAMYPNDNGDLRDGNENFVPFDKYVKNYREKGTRYAWRDEEDDDWWRGGRGENPSFDDILNGTHGGYYAFRDSMWEQGRPKGTALINALQEAGYVGIEYDGGKRIKTARGDQNRGGGGRRHRAFVLWNTEDLHRFRVAHAPLPRDRKISSRSLVNKT